MFSGVDEGIDGCRVPFLGTQCNTCHRTSLLLCHSKHGTRVFEEGARESGWERSSCGEQKGHSHAGHWVCKKDPPRNW